jgi:hypothetical protein
MIVSGNIQRIAIKGIVRNKSVGQVNLGVKVDAEKKSGDK